MLQRRLDTAELDPLNSAYYNIDPLVERPEADQRHDQRTSSFSTLQNRLQEWDRKGGMIERAQDPHRIAHVDVWLGQERLVVEQVDCRQQANEMSRRAAGFQDLEDRPSQAAHRPVSLFNSQLHASAIVHI